jgi:hypothetical protein
MAAKTGRPKNNPIVRMTDEHRVKIANSNILSALLEHVEGKREMSSTQVTAGLGLLKKALPDLAQVDHKGSGPGGEFELVTRIERIIVKASKTSS